MNFTLKIWRQKGPAEKGRLMKYKISNVSSHMSFLEMLDVLNEQLMKKGEDVIEFDSDCREGICGTCGLVINGISHGGRKHTATCQLHMRHFRDGETITVEPFRAEAFPLVKDLVIDRSAFDRIMMAGGYISVRTGSAPDANLIPVSKKIADQAMDSAECIGCGACVAACPNASASLFVGAKISHLSLLPQGLPEKQRRAERMIAVMDKEGFGNCTNHAECEAVCPKGISISNIARMRREYFRTLFSGEK
jgi:succinate dehydrogenase / fumarate reductase iron-sulfur subunit